MKGSQAELVSMWNISIHSNLILLLSIRFNKHFLGSKHCARENSCSCEFVINKQTNLLTTSKYTYNKCTVTNYPGALQHTVSATTNGRARWCGRPAQGEWSRKPFLGRWYSSWDLKDESAKWRGGRKEFQAKVKDLEVTKNSVYSGARGKEVTGGIAEMKLGPIHAGGQRLWGDVRLYSECKEKTLMCFSRVAWSDFWLLKLQNKAMKRRTHTTLETSWSRILDSL